MDFNFQQGKDLIAQKVKQFAANRAVYLAPAYKEAHARQELIDPFFEALGWDVRNTERAAPDYRQVVVEDSLDVEGQRKAPDYAFRIGDKRKFFVEAKKPGVDLKADARPAYQLLQRLIDSTDRQIDLLVYALYGLTAEEIAIVEGKAVSP